MGFGIALGIGSALLGASSARRNAKAANRAAQLQHEATMASVNFAKQQYADWKAIYGPIEKNLGDFYNTLDTQFFARRSELAGMQQLSDYRAQLQEQQLEMEDYFAANEIETHVQADIRSKMEMQGIRDEAQIRANMREDIANADLKVVEAKQAFLTTGLNAKAGAATNVQTSLTNLATHHGNRATQYAANADAGFAAVTTGLNSIVQLNENEKNRAAFGNPEID